MKIKISKSQWEEMGKIARWIEGLGEVTSVHDDHIILKEINKEVITFLRVLQDVHMYDRGFRTNTGFMSYDYETPAKNFKQTKQEFILKMTELLQKMNRH